MAASLPDLTLNFIFARGIDPLGQDPKRCFAEDGIHPSAAAYALCCCTVRSRTPLREALVGSARSAAPIIATIPRYSPQSVDAIRAAVALDVRAFGILLHGFGSGRGALCVRTIHVIVGRRAVALGGVKLDKLRRRRGTRLAAIRGRRSAISQRGRMITTNGGSS